MVGRWKSLLCQWNWFSWGQVGMEMKSVRWMKMDVVFVPMQVSTVSASAAAVKSVCRCWSAVEPILKQRASKSIRDFQRLGSFLLGRHKRWQLQHTVHHHNTAKCVQKITPLRFSTIFSWRAENFRLKFYMPILCLHLCNILKLYLIIFNFNKVGSY